MIATVAVAIGLCAGALAGWSARAPTSRRFRRSRCAGPPGSGSNPGWSAIPRQGSAEEQLRYAQLIAPRDEWAASWLAVPGHYPHSHDASSKAYTQLARLWYRLDDDESLAALAAELPAWKDAQKRDKATRRADPDRARP